MSADFDVAVVGAGVLGLAHAYHAARRGGRVVVFERNRRAEGASIRNFGMIWPIGQPTGPRYDLARRSRHIWLELLRAAGLWHDPCGSLHLAYHDDEAQVLREFAEHTRMVGRSGELLSAAKVTSRFPAVRCEGLRAGLWSDQEVTVDPRQVIADLPRWLERNLGVTFLWGTPVMGFDPPRVLTPTGEWRAARLIVCTGVDYRELAPASFVQCGLIHCKLQMMRTAPCFDRIRLGTMLAAGLTLGHYPAFASCPTLPALKQRLQSELPEYIRYGIHVMAAQNGRGEIVLGDSHEYGEEIEPFDKPQIDELVLQYLQKFLRWPDLEIASRWHGTYVRHPTDPYVITRPASDVWVVTGVGGAGMTLSMGLAEMVIRECLGEAS
ncbi:MAG: TIGR03364 family FAD-dependent oxidoreductase [Gemmataceae bacterium]|nr:TIGR03364 family FAD-dependent oxidoreductase [Gemmataceae bacterium]